MNTTYRVYSDGEPLFEFHLEDSDMWYMFGKIVEIDSQLTLSQIYISLYSLSFERFFKQDGLAYRCTLIGETELQCLLIQCNEDTTCFRVVTSEEAQDFSGKKYDSLLSIIKHDERILMNKVHPT